VLLDAVGNESGIDWSLYKNIFMLLFHHVVLSTKGYRP
jgi:hypothetical protein